MPSTPACTCPIAMLNGLGQCKRLQIVGERTFWRSRGCPAMAAFRCASRRTVGTSDRRSGPTSASSSSAATCAASARSDSRFLADCAAACASARSSWPRRKAASASPMVRLISPFSRTSSCAALATSLCARAPLLSQRYDAARLPAGELRQQLMWNSLGGRASHAPHLTVALQSGVETVELCRRRAPPLLALSQRHRLVRAALRHIWYRVP